MEHEVLINIAIIFAFTVLVTSVCHFFRIPHVIGYIITGIILSPNTSTLLGHPEEIDMYAEIGVIFLLFSIGLEFSFGHLKKIRDAVLKGGSLQLLLTTLLAGLVMFFIYRSGSEAVLWGFIVTCSSTAIVIKQLQDKGQIGKPYGRAALGILLFQDIAVVPMMLMIPLLAGQYEDSLFQVAGTMLLKLLVLALISVVLAKYIIPKFFRRIRNMQSLEIFLIATFTVVLGITLLSYSLGLSLALGAFIAGIIIAETDYNRVAISCVLPFRYVFLSFFFVAMGMLLDYKAVIANPLNIVLGLLILYVFKALAVYLSARLLKLSVQNAVITALCLTQIGEFSLILAKSGLDMQLLDGEKYQSFLAVAIISMCFTPLLIENKERIARIFPSAEEKEPAVL